MNRKILISAAIVTLLIVLVGGFLVLRNPQTQTENSPLSSSPFGEGGEGNGFVNTENPFVLGPDQTEAKVEDRNGLQKISSAPVSGATFVSGPATTASPSVHFIERATGHIFEANLETDLVERISNTTIPKIERGLWGNNTSIFAQYNEDGRVRGEILSLTVEGTSTPATTNRSSLADNILEVSFSPNGSSLFYVTEGVSGGEGYTMSISERVPILIWSFPITDWLPQWFSENTVALTTKASNNIPGALYFLNIQTKAQTRILGNVPGLTTLVSPSGDKILYSSSQGANTNLYVYDLETKTTRDLLLSTTAEKCAWGTGELFVYCAQPKNLGRDFPDAWYQGLATLQDDLWRIGVANGSKEYISELQPSADEYLDATDLHVSAQGDYLLFTNKKDLSLWVVPLR